MKFEKKFFFALSSVAATAALFKFLLFFTKGKEKEEIGRVS